MRIRFLEDAQREVDDAVAWYNDRENELGYDFLDELDRAIRRVKSFPLASTEIEPGIRRCLLGRFPLWRDLRNRRTANHRHCCFPPASTTTILD